MKNLVITTIVLMTTLLTIKTANAQTENPETTDLDYKYKDALNEQMNKYGMKVFDFPSNDPCNRTGNPLVKRNDLISPAFPSDSNPVIRFWGNKDSIILMKGPEDINIIWIHGLNGTTESLRWPAQATQAGSVGFPARKARSHRGTASSSGIQFYSENGGITSATLDLENAMNAVLPISERKPNDFIIAHSQGGIVAREWLRKMEMEPNTYQKFAHGMVTFGTPHDGAEILNNTRDDMGDKIPKFMKDACEALSDPLIVPLVNSNFVTSLLISKEMIKIAQDKACGVIGNTIIPFALDNYFKRTTRDYYVGSPFLTGYNEGGVRKQGLSEYTLKVPVVQFYGEEEQPILWRFTSSTMEMGHDKLNNNEAVFGYDKDDQLQNKVSDMINDFEAKSNLEAKKVKDYKLQAKRYNSIAIVYFARHNYFLGTAALVAAGLATKNKQSAQENEFAYNRGKNWLSNANDYYLTDLVGARVNQTTLNCKVVADLQCRDLRKNPVGSGVPAVNVKVNYSFNTTAPSCAVQPFNITYANYHFIGHDNTPWNGPCTGFETIIPTWKTTYYYKPNDGIVLAESASKKILVNTNVNPLNTHAIVRMDKTNHDQMKNSVETKKALLVLYGGDKYGQFFKVDIR
jgi:hypothetical protein